MHLRECRGVLVTFRFNGHQGYDYVVVGKNMLHLDSEDTAAQPDNGLWPGTCQVIAGSNASSTAGMSPLAKSSYALRMIVAFVETMVPCPKL